ncbi:hypothetical protein ABMA28_005406 [Loxostege sticticalis]|uniref:Mitochondrial 2-oxoglutarate/malate carrier protein n=1 Tax=Loxostege sticticalis TaxID=481309 RepID=A0ABD0SQB2_LOXSC
MLATVLVHPLDVIKNRLQLHEKKLSTMQMARLMVRCEGFKALYVGLTAGLMRQATSTTTRLTTYHILNEYYKGRTNVPQSSSLNTHDKVTIGIYAGLAGALVGNPSEVALVRMMADGPSPCSVRRCPRRYRGVLHAFYRIVREDGFFTLWRGGSLTMYRSMLVSTAQIGTYAEVNEFLRQNQVLQNYYTTHVVTSMASSLVTTILSLPIDVVKTRYQVRSDTMTQRDILNEIVLQKGIRYLWKGVTPYFIRMFVYTTGHLMFFEFFAEKFFRKEDKKV